MIKVERFEDLILSQIDDDWYFQKLTSFYTKKDKDDPSLTERGVAEMQAKFPITLEMAVYVCDPDIKARELRELETIIKSFCPNYTYEELDYDHELTNYTGADPEVDTSSKRNALTPGVDYAAYPKSRSFVGGINITF